VFEVKNVFGKKVNVVDKKSMGISTVKNDIPQHLLLSVVTTMIHLYLLGTGKLGFDNVLVSGDRAYVIDYGTDPMDTNVRMNKYVSHTRLRWKRLTERRISSYTRLPTSI
jgi:hypothetical protein